MKLTITVYENGVCKETLGNPDWLPFCEINDTKIWKMIRRDSKEWKLEHKETNVLVSLEKETIAFYISIKQKKNTKKRKGNY